MRECCLEKCELEAWLENMEFNVLVYGHIHHAKFYWEKDILYINPGSPTFPLPPFFIKPTVALLKLNRKKIEPRIVRLKKKPY